MYTSYVIFNKYMNLHRQEDPCIFAAICVSFWKIKNKKTPKRECFHCSALISQKSKWKIKVFSFIVFDFSKTKIKKKQKWFRFSFLISIKRKRKTKVFSIFVFDFSKTHENQSISFFVFDFTQEEFCIWC